LPEIRDPIHGFIELSDEEMEIIDSAPFQRLRRIRQLATTYLVYPSAEHTRFPHSLGVMHVATLIFDKVIQKQKRDGVLDWNQEQIDAYRQKLRLAALLHDLGHGPFSHLGDRLFHPSVKTHENMAAKLVEETELAEKIDRIGEKHGFNAKHIASLIRGAVFKAEDQLLVSIFASELDADKMDYLLRDSLFAGVKYGYFDLDRVLNVVNLFPKDGTWLLGFESDGLEAVEALILARYFMYKQVYFHRTRRMYDYILEKVVRGFLKDKFGDECFPQNPDEFLSLDDESIFQYAKASSQKNSWAGRFLRREHFREVWSSDRLADTFADSREYDEQVAQMLKGYYKEDQVFVDRFVKAPIRFADEDNSPTIHIIDRKDQTVTYSLREMASVVSKLEDPIYVFRVYAEEKIAQDVYYRIKKIYHVFKK